MSASPLPKTPGLATPSRPVSAMMCGAAECSKLAIWAENVKEIHFHNVKLEGYAGERLNFINVGSFKED